jgi:hypothetical protein
MEWECERFHLDDVVESSWLLCSGHTTLSHLLSSPMQGILNNLTGIATAADLSTVNGIYRSNDQRSLVVASGGNSFSPVPLKLFRFPCYKTSKAKEYYAHSSAVEDVCYLSQDDDVCSVGGSDTCVMCWRHTY